MKIIKQGNIGKKEYKMVCWQCDCVAMYTSDDIHYDQRDGAYVICPCCGKFVNHNG